MYYCKDCKYYLGRGHENTALAKCELIGKNRTMIDYCSRFVNPKTDKEERIPYKCEWKLNAREMVWLTSCETQFDGESGMLYCPSCSAKIKYIYGEN